MTRSTKRISRTATAARPARAPVPTGEPAEFKPRLVGAETGRPATPHSALAECARELNENLAALQGLLRQLLTQAEQKLDAIRAADTEALHRCAARETDVLADVTRGEQRRKAILARLAQRAPEAAGPPVRLSELVRRLPEPFSSVLRARSAALRQIATQLQEKNGVVARVAYNLQSHIREIFAELAKTSQESVVYGPKGQHESRSVRSWLDAVG